MGRKAQRVDPYEMWCRVDLDHAAETRRKVAELFAEVTSEVIVSAETKEGGGNPHYHVIGKFVYSEYIVGQRLHSRLALPPGNAHKATGVPVEGKGGYSGMQRYTVKGVASWVKPDIVFTTFSDDDIAEMHAAYWKQNAELRKQAALNLSVTDTILEWMTADVSDERLIRRIVEEYTRRKSKFNDHQVTALANLARCHASEEGVDRVSARILSRYNK